MSDVPMTNGGEPIEEPFVELTIALPPHWNVSAEGFQAKATWQSVLLLKQLARYPISNRTFLAKYHSVTLGGGFDPMKAVLLMPPVLIPELSEPLALPDGQHIRFLSPYLLHERELDLKLAGGLDDLFAAFGEREVTELYDLARPSAI